jgi:hypothetical protein
VRLFGNGELGISGHDWEKEIRQIGKLAQKRVSS